MNRALVASTLACLLGLGANAFGAAPPRTSSLGWVRAGGAESCVGARELANAVEQRLGRRVFVSASQAEVFIEGSIQPSMSGRGFQSRLVLTDEKGAVLGSRDIESPSLDCREADEQLALVIALLIDPDAALAPRGPPTPIQPLQPQLVYVPFPVLAKPPPERFRASLGLGTSLVFGLLPSVGVGIALRGEVEPPSFVPIELGATVFLDARAEAGTRGATLSTALGSLGLCPLAWRGRSTALRACAAMQAGAMKSSGFGFRASESQESAIVLPQIEGHLRQRLIGALDLGLGLSLGAPLTRPRFFFLDATGAEQELYRVGAVTAGAEGTVGFAFP